MSISVAAHIYVLLAGCQAASGPIEVRDAWAPATPPNATVGGAYMRIEAREPDTLLSASTRVATSVEVHATSSEGDVVTMRKLDSISLGPSQPATFEPGGMHFMLIGLTSPLQANSRIPMTLQFQNAGEIRVDIDVLAPNSAPAHH